MTRSQRNMTVEARADLILADKPSVKAYTTHFETQMHCGKVRRLLFTSCRWLARGITSCSLLHCALPGGPDMYGS